jgi:hypothetical protein
MLVGASVLIIAAFMSTVVLADAYQIPGPWVVLGWLSVMFFAIIGWGYRKELKSIGFVLFLLVWALLHPFILAFSIKLLSWPFYPVVVCVALFVLFVRAQLLFRVQPPRRR